jgi:TetR/AcrR family transcriptional repressor of mexJK operon
MGNKMQILKRQPGVATDAKAEPARPPAGPSDTARLLHLIQAAETTFLEKGYHTATMSDVAKAAGMSKKTVYKLIESKVELFAALVENREAKLTIPVIDKNWTINETLVQILLRIGEYLLAPEQIAMTRLIMAEYTHSDDFARVFHRRRVKKSKWILERLLAEIAHSDCENTVQPAEMAAMLFGMTIGEYQVSALLGYRPVPSKAAMTRRVRSAVNIFLTGYATK